MNARHGLSSLCRVLVRPDMAQPVIARGLCGPFVAIVMEQDEGGFVLRLSPALPGVPTHLPQAGSAGEGRGAAQSVTANSAVIASEAKQSRIPPEPWIASLRSQ
ncbi:hypothetical protein ACVIJ6_002557 [Bradyrhizobium sp. USDA 4369]